MSIYKYKVGDLVCLTPEIEKEYEQWLTPDHQYPGEVFVIVSRSVLDPYGPATYTLDPYGFWRETLHFYYEAELLPILLNPSRLFKTQTLPKI